MTISSTTVKNSYSGDGSTTTFSYTFKIFQDSDIQVIIRSSTGTETIKTLTTHYTVTGAGASGGGSVVFTSGNIPTSTQTVVLRRNIPQTQSIDYIANDPFPAESHEEGLDRATMAIQQLQEEVTRSIKLSKTNTMTSTEFTVGASDRANKILAFDSSGEISVTQELGTYAGNWTTATTYYARDLVKDTSNGNIYICNTNHTSTGTTPISSNADSAKWNLIVDNASASANANAAANHASNSSNYANNSSNSANTAANHASNASNFANNASNSANTASTYLSSVQANANAAANSASNASNFANNSSNSANSAANHSANSSNFANNASNHASNSSNHASNASNFANNSSNSANASANHASNSSNFANNSSNSANTSANHASNSSNHASNSSNFANNSSNSANTSANHASNSSNFANNSSNSANSSSNFANNSSNFANNASNHASNASNHASNASNSASDAANSYDAFDDRYLGAKSSAPTLDNDGNALITGALYWNTTANQLYVWNVSTWEAAAFSTSGSVTSFNTRTGAVSLTSTDVTTALGLTPISASSSDTLTNKTFDTAGTGNVFRVNGTGITDKTGTGKVVLDTSPTLVTPVLGTPTSGTLTNCTSLPISGITSSTSTALGVGSIELGHATDTTIARVSAGVASIEGVNIVTTSSTDTLTNKTLTSPTINTFETYANQAEIRFAEATANGSNYVGFKGASNLTANKIWVLPTADGTANQAIVTDGSGNLSFATAGIAWQSVQTSGFTAVAGRGYPCNTTSAAFTVTLPASATAGDTIVLVDYARTWGTNKITINQNSLKFQGYTSPNPEYNTNGQSVTLVYVDSTQGWIPLTDDDVTLETPQSYSIDFLVVGGGGGGGTDSDGGGNWTYGGGGGGAGGYRTSTQTVNVGTVITVTVGDGGTGGVIGSGTPAGAGVAGSNSSISGSGLTTITSAGGGYGGTEGSSGVTNGGNGGSGGSGGGGGGWNGRNTTGGTGNTPSTTPSQGSDGGNSTGSTNIGGAGGGGASATGGSTTSGTTGATGGAGTASSITGSSVTYAGGGGGGQGASGGSGGGGSGGATSNSNGSAGTANTGGGGGAAGGGSSPSSEVGGAGGKGVIILRMLTSDYSGTTTGSPTVTTDGSYKVVKFTGSGSYTT